jgi:hypothetical protein
LLEGFFYAQTPSSLERFEHKKNLLIF